MPLVGVICGYDETYQSFDHCISCHEKGNCERNCDALTFVLKAMRDNAKTRVGAGISASTLTSCARATALQETYDYYEDVKSGYNKSRGTWVHAMIESDDTPREGLIRELRIEKYFPIRIDGEESFVRVTGKPDEVDTERRVLIDYKSKDRIPTKSDDRHEAQFNVYCWLLDGGTLLESDEYGHTAGDKVSVKIRGGGMHYVTWNPKAPWKKMAYPVWSEDRINAFLKERLTPLVEWRTTKKLPSCNAYIRYSKRWDCDCVKLERQLEERGVISKDEDTFS